MFMLSASSKMKSDRALKPTDSAIRAYYAELEAYGRQGVLHEGAVSSAFEKLLAECARRRTDRLHGREGIVAFVSNNSFVDQYAFDGMRKHLLQDFTGVYHVDLHGNVRRNPKLSGTTHNVFYYVYGVLHHPSYREKFAENLKRELPRIPFVGGGKGGVSTPPEALTHRSAVPPLPAGEGQGVRGSPAAGLKPRPSAELTDAGSAFWAVSRAGRELAELHINYETLEPYPLQWMENLPWRATTCRTRFYRLARDLITMGVPKKPNCSRMRFSR